MIYSEVVGEAPGVECIPMPELQVERYLALDDARLSSYLAARRDNPAWVFFPCWDSGCLLGYSFLHAPAHEEWNDCLPTRPGEARIGSTYVYPQYRGRGVRGEIYKKQWEYVVGHGLKLWAVIEKRNSSSLRAAEKTGRVGRKNYLVKILGRNVLSILTKPAEIYVLQGSRRARR